MDSYSRSSKAADELLKSLFFSSQLESKTPISLINYIFFKTHRSRWDCLLEIVRGVYQLVRSPPIRCDKRRPWELSLHYRPEVSCSLSQLSIFNSVFGWEFWKGNEHLSLKKVFSVFLVSINSVLCLASIDTPSWTSMTKYWFIYFIHFYAELCMMILYLKQHGLDIIWF